MKKIMLLISLTVLVSCGYRVDKTQSEAASPEPPPSSSGSEAPLTDQQITFKMVSDSVLGVSCLRCHSVVGGDRGGINLETYQNVFDVIDLVRSEVVSGSMPRAPVAKLNRAQQDLILRWIDAGAKEFAKNTPN